MKPPNPQAFARPHSSAQGLWAEAQLGMTLRDYFAGNALAGLCAHPATQRPVDGNHTQLVSDAYVLADAMLIERDK